MPSYSRRESITDAQIQTRGIGLRSLRTVRHGTRAWGLRYAGTVSYRVTFSGTPVVLLTARSTTVSQQLRGSGTLQPIRVTSVQSGSFFWAGSPRGGTFSWLAIGSYVE